MTILRVAAPVRQQIADSIRQAVLEQRLVPGDRLIERELCETMGASRSSVREALRQLESEGLVVTVPQKGVFVALVSDEDARAIYAVRGVLEGLAARLFTEKATVGQRAEIRRVAEELASTDDPVVALETKNRFYDVLFAGARSAVIIQLIGPLHTRVAILRARSLSREGRAREAAVEIMLIVEAVERSDADAAAAAASFHVSQAAKIIFDDPESDR